MILSFPFMVQIFFGRKVLDKEQVNVYNKY